jgi:uncharacterized LabA/DUF88 family protein
VSPRDVQPDARGCVEWLSALARRLALTAPSPLLRVYWYDGAFDAADPRYGGQRVFFDAIASTPGIQLRLGHLRERTPRWQHAVRNAVLACGVDLAKFEMHFQFRAELEQKGVDTLIALDLVRLAQRGAYETALLVAGDRDLAEAVRVAQDEGRRVIVAPPTSGGVATELRQVADVLHPLEEADLRQMLRMRGKAAPPG